MTLGNMRSLGLRSVDVTCTACGYHATFNVDEWPDELPVLAFGPHTGCAKCGHRGASVLPDWTQLRGVPGKPRA
jgi:ribosomal protein L37E